MKRTLQLGLVGLLLAATSFAQDKASRMTPELLWKLGRLAGGAYSPDGAWVVFGQRHYDLARNSGDSDLWLIKLADGTSRALTSGAGSEHDFQWATTPAGPRLFFLAARGDDGSQAWVLDPAGGEARRVTREAGGIANLKVAPDGRHLAFTRDVKLDPEVKDVYPDLPLASGRIIDSLMYRHWDSWHDYAYSHLFVAPLGEDLVAGPATDLMEGLKVDCPVPPFGGSEQFAWSPAGDEIAFTMKIANDWAESTDSDVYLVKLDGDGRKRCLTEGMDGYDNDPVYSPDGRWLLFHSMERAGFESDRNRIMLCDRESGAISELSAGLDQMAHGSLWAPDSSRVYFSSEWRGCDQLFSLDLGTRTLTQLTKGWFNHDLRDVSPDGKTLLVGRQSMIRPTELGQVPAAGGGWTALTDLNADLYGELELPSVTERWVRATDGKMIHNWVVLPPNFDPKKRYPMLVYFQGGPQGQIGQWFSFRWNFHLMAAQGYVVLAVNRRGLPGFGRAWNDAISKDWGGQAMKDILAATDDLVTEPWIDARRVGGIGASFGGYTAYWMMGNAGDRFAAMIAHAGVFNLESMYGVTEELFFVNWDIGGPYWRSAELKKAYDRFSPHRFIGNWKTPLLVIHGEKDFRVPVGEGMQAFSAAQLQGVPSRFLYFPDECHWVLGPQNGVLWHRVFFDWLDRWLKRP
ncbi:MAG: S9 family peptidase [Planctomycetes bacterium]|nr:S9 family peptidase [Planctomycetota bacterium]